MNNELNELKRKNIILEEIYSKKCFIDILNSVLETLSNFLLIFLFLCLMTFSGITVFSLKIVFGAILFLNVCIFICSYLIKRNVSILTKEILLIERYYKNEKKKLEIND